MGFKAWSHVDQTGLTETMLEDAPVILISLPLTPEDLLERWSRQDMYKCKRNSSRVAKLSHKQASAVYMLCIGFQGCSC